jgi:hypothetical protein
MNEIAVFWNSTPCGPAEVDGRSGGTSFTHPQSQRAAKCDQVYRSALKMEIVRSSEISFSWIIWRCIQNDGYSSTQNTGNVLVS